jgi:hypothetical protein
MLTFIGIEDRKRFDEEVCATACNMHEGSLFSQPKSRCNSETLKKLAAGIRK